MIKAIKDALGDLGLDAEAVSSKRGIELVLNTNHLGTSFQLIEALDEVVEAWIERLRHELDLDFDYRLELGQVVLIPLV